MYRDPLIRSYADRPPLVPGSLTRFRWPEPGDPEVRMIRERVQESGKGLYILRAPYPDAKVLVEAHYPNGMRPHYIDNHLDPYRKEDVQMGRLVVVRVFDDIKPPDQPLDMRHIREIRRNNRNARGDLRRQSSGHARRLALEDRRRKEEQPVFDRWNSFVKQAKADTRKFAATPHVGPARSLSLGG